MTLAGEPVLRTENISKAFPGVQALSDFNFELKSGEVRALLGKNGAGKSTLVKILSGALSPDSGCLYLNGKPLALPSPASAFAAGIATVYQEMSLVPGLTVAENIFLGRWPQRRRLGFRIIDREASRRQARAALDRMAVPLEPDTPVSRLSIAQRQMVEIARGLSFQPRVLILDEPTSALPQAEVDHLLDLVRRLAEAGVAIIYVSHRLQEVLRVADRLTVLRDGRAAGTISVGEASAERLAEMVVGGEWRPRQRVASEKRGEVRLAVRHLYSCERLLDICFDLHAGEVLGLAGLLGAGRTELLRTLFGLEPLEKGEIQIDGQSIDHPTPIRMKSKGIGLTPEDRKAEGLVLVLGVEDNLTMACPGRISRYQVLFPRKRRALAEQMVRLLQIVTPGLKTTARTLSGGNQQKLVIGKWLNADVKILLMDEPTRGMDIHAKEQVYKLIADLAEQGIAILFVSSEMEEILRVADRILILNQGRITAELPACRTGLEQVLALAMQESPPQ
jgi:sugar transport system ATP-binding protein